MGSRNNEQRKVQRKAGGRSLFKRQWQWGEGFAVWLCEPGSESGIYSKGDGSHGGDLDRERHGLVGGLSITLM